MSNKADKDAYCVAALALARILVTGQHTLPLRAQRLAHALDYYEWSAVLSDLGDHKCAEFNCHAKARQVAWNLGENMRFVCDRHAREYTGVEGVISLDKEDGQ